MNAPVWTAPPPPESVEEAWLNRLFLQARTYTRWQARPLPKAVIRRLYDLVRLGPTAANSAPARFVFVTSPQAKARLLPHLSKGNQPKADEAPCTVLIGYDRDFTRHLPRLYPHVPNAASWFANPETAKDSAIKNASLQAAYLIIAARALGLDAGPMTGFDQAGLDAEFFPDGDVTTIMLCNIGFGRPDGLKERLPRLDFEEACHVL